MFSKTKTTHTKSEITVGEGELIPCDGQVIEGFARVDESAIAGVSIPVLIEAGTERDQVYAGGLVVEGSLRIKCTN
jgi:potassium-transporting ATPase ATP-binding subunit